jgi:glucokinase
MGVCVPGTIDVHKGIVLDAPALKWWNLNLREEIQAHFSFPVFIENDVNCAATGERWLGSGSLSDDMLFIAIGTGVGGAVIANGQLVHGFRHQAGEIAYSIFKEDIEQGQLNADGEFGVFEKKVSGLALAQHGYRTEDLFKEYVQGNESAEKVIAEFILNLSIVIANIVSILNPEKVVIGGGVSESMDVVVEEIQKAVDRYTVIKTEVVLATLRGEAGALGAIHHAFKEVQESHLVPEHHAL